MRTHILHTVSTALLIVCPAVPALAEAPAEIVSTAKDQAGLSLTIYNGNLALVKDRRTFDLPGGVSRLAFREVSARIRPETALLSGGPEILEQNFEYDLLTPEALLHKYVGREVGLVRQHPATGEDLPQERARVLAAADGVVLLVNGRIETGVPGRIIYPDLPANLRDRPTLTMLVSSPQAGPQEAELSYLTRGLSWRADYVAELGTDEKSLNLKGWVTLENESGADYREARLQLVAGKVHLVPDVREEQVRMALPMVESRAAKTNKAMEEETMFEYHLYTLDRPTTVLEKQKKQVALLQAADVAAEKRLILRGEGYYYRGQAQDLGDRREVDVEMEIKNEKERGLGLPIPAGTVRVYKKDSRGFLQFVGEDNIDHTPDKETMRLHLGTAFDVTASKKQTQFKKTGGSTAYNYQFESSYEIVLKNAKDEPVRVKVIEPIPGDWKILEESARHERASAHEAVWQIDVPAKGQTSLHYSVRVQM